MMTMWKIIPKTNNRYKISNYGDVYSNIVKRKLKPHLDNRRLRIKLYIDKNKYKTYYIDELVYQLFKGNIKSDKHICYIDKNVYNCHVDNLKLIKIKMRNI